MSKIGTLCSVFGFNVLFLGDEVRNTGVQFFQFFN